MSAQDGKPAHFIWKKQKLMVNEIADQWRESGRWWEKESICDFFLVNTLSGPFLLSRNFENGLWYAKSVQ